MMSDIAGIVSSSKKVIVGNWKMNKTPSETKAMIAELTPLLKVFDHKVMIAPSYVCLPSAACALTGSGIGLVAQDVSAHENGAYTGEVSVGMLKDIGVSAVILGHSERRQYHNETNELVNQKLRIVLGAGMIGIVCVGETLLQREAGQMFPVIRSQLEGSVGEISEELASKLIIAYEPVWAIGTGKTASSAQVNEMHISIRNDLLKLFPRTGGLIPIQYGGSVKPDNVKELMAVPSIDGALVGGASLDARSFASLINF